MKDYKVQLKPEGSTIPAQRERRYFSVEVRKQIVAEIDAGLSKAEASRKYSVSQGSIYKWIVQYSSKYQKALVTIVEDLSATNKVKQLEQQLKDAYESLGRLQAKTMFLEKVIELADEAGGVDLKKNFGS
jgi:transposase